MRLRPDKKEQRQQEALARQVEYDKLSLHQKLVRQWESHRGSKEETRLFRRYQLGET